MLGFYFCIVFVYENISFVLQNLLNFQGRVFCSVKDKKNHKKIISFCRLVRIIFLMHPAKMTLATIWKKVPTETCSTFKETLFDYNNNNQKSNNNKINFNNKQTRLINNNNNNSKHTHMYSRRQIRWRMNRQKCLLCWYIQIWNFTFISNLC
jgi:hypothetical protein